MQELRSITMRIDKAEIALNDIRIHAFHGVMPQERVEGTEYIVNVVCCLADANDTVGRILATDDVEDTVDYSVISRIVEEEMMIPSNLIEHVAARIGSRILQMEKIQTATVRIEKLNPPMPGSCHNASVCLEMKK